DPARARVTGAAPADPAPVTPPGPRPGPTTAGTGWHTPPPGPRGPRRWAPPGCPPGDGRANLAAHGYGAAASYPPRPAIERSRLSSSLLSVAPGREGKPLAPRLGLASAPLTVGQVWNLPTVGKFQTCPTVLSRKSYR